MIAAMRQAEERKKELEMKQSEQAESRKRRLQSRAPEVRDEQNTPGEDGNKTSNSNAAGIIVRDEGVETPGTKEKSRTMEGGVGDGPRASSSPDDSSEIEVHGNSRKGKGKKKRKKEGKEGEREELPGESDSDDNRLKGVEEKYKTLVQKDQIPSLGGIDGVGPK
ncbi:hypothetical protein DFH28DRAFT_928533 [Melampsora americana]|nr:hypothetical protein DFH28DRAFT_928533 [Melampsora americana]